LNNIRFATFDDIEDIMNFIHNHWKKNHILSKNKKLFIYEYQDKDRINFVISRNKSQEINGILGFIRSSSRSSDVWGAMWKTIKNSENPMLGIELFQKLRTSTEYGIFTASGISSKTIGIYNYLGIYTNHLSQYLIVNSDIENYNILKIKDKNNLIPINFLVNSEYTLMRVNEDKLDFNFSDYSYFIPHKDKEYFVKRYFNHPVYTYKIYGICKNSILNSLIVTREVVVGNSKILRIMDYLGDENDIVYISKFLHQIILDNDYEYIDFMCYGFSEKTLEKACFTKVDLISKELIVPNYFAPFVQENIKINFMADTKEIDKLRICKADGDQDRPN